MLLLTLIILPVSLLFCYWMVSERRNVKQHYYYATTNSGNHHYHDAVDCFFSEENEGEILTEEEYKAYKILQEVPDTSSIGRTIRSAVDEKDRRIFRKLIKELYEQSNDAPDLLCKIIGVEGMEAVRNAFFS